jgi:hypothetical protein
VRNGRIQKASIAAAGARGHFPCFQDYHLARRVFLLRQERCPQARKPRANDQEIGGDASPELWLGRRARRIVQPEWGVTSIGDRSKGFLSDLI